MSLSPSLMDDREVSSAGKFVGTLLRQPGQISHAVSLVVWWYNFFPLLHLLGDRLRLFATDSLDVLRRGQNQIYSMLFGSLT